MKPTSKDEKSSQGLMDLLSNAFRTQTTMTECNMKRDTNNKNFFFSFHKQKDFISKRNEASSEQQQSNDTLNTIEPYELPTFLNNPTCTPLLIDMRPLDLYEKSRIRHSVHMAVPTLIIKRYRKGVISNLDLESFISTSEGIDIYKSWLKQFRVDDINHLPKDAQFILYDEEMADPTSPPFVLSRAIQKNTEAAVNWLKSGYNGFFKWDFTNEYTTSNKYSFLSNPPPSNKLKSPIPVVSKSATTNPNKSKVNVPRRASLFNLDTSIKHKATPKTENEFDFIISEIIPNFLYLGPEITTLDQLVELKTRSIQRILNMAEECDDDVSGLKERFHYEKVPARDTIDMQNVQCTLEKAVHVINESKIHGEAIYVHCKAGKSRSAAAILAYLVMSENWTLKKAYQHLVKARPNISPNIGFIAELMKMEQAIHGKVSNLARD